jgi:hypothetical protein
LLGGWIELLVLESTRRSEKRKERKRRGVRRSDSRLDSDSWAEEAEDLF